MKYSAFSYKKGNSFLHKCPSWCKLLFIPLINILFLFLPVYFALFLILIQTVVAFYLHFSLKEQLADLRPVLFYGVLLLIFKIISYAFSGTSFLEIKENWWIEEKETVFLLIKLFCIMQSVSLIFKTSTSLELREGIEKIELWVRKKLHLKEKRTFTNAIFMFLNFIPMVSKIWQQSQRAWIARGGKKSLKMYMILLPVLFSVGMKKAYNMARAIEIRS